LYNFDLFVNYFLFFGKNIFYIIIYFLFFRKFEEKNKLITCAKDMKSNKLIIADRTFNSRLFVGTGKFQSNEMMKQAIISSGTEMVTVAMKRIDLDSRNDDMFEHIVAPNIQFLPNTSGARDAKEAIFAAQLSREAFQTNWLKLEIHPDPKYLLPDPIETLKATEELSKMGFVVLPYIQADPVLCKLLEEAGASTVMPLGSPIGSNKGLKTKEMLKIIIEQSNIPVVVDAGIGAPSQAAEAMEMGADAVLINTAIAVAGKPIEMAKAFSMAVIAGRMAYEASLGRVNNSAIASSPLTSFLN
jgi:thiazole synthase